MQAGVQAGTVLSCVSQKPRSTLRLAYPHSTPTRRAVHMKWAAQGRQGDGSFVWKTGDPSPCLSHKDGAHEMCRLPQHSAPRTQAQDGKTGGRFFHFVGKDRGTVPLSCMQVKNRPRLAPTCMNAKTVHMKCTVSPTIHSRPKPRTQCHTSATSLRKQPSKLPFKRPTPNTGQCTRMCTAANAPRMALLAGTPLPIAGA